MDAGQPEEVAVEKDVPLGSIVRDPLVPPWATDTRPKTRSEQIRECEDSIAEMTLQIDRYTLNHREFELRLREREAKKRSGKEVPLALGWRAVLWWRSAPTRKVTEDDLENLRQVMRFITSNREAVEKRREEVAQRLVTLRRDRWHEDRQERAKAREQGMERSGHEGRGR